MDEIVETKIRLLQVKTLGTDIANMQMLTCIMCILHCTVKAISRSHLSLNMLNVANDSQLLQNEHEIPTLVIPNERTTTVANVLSISLETCTYLSE